MPHCEAANMVAPRASLKFTDLLDLDCLVRRVVGELHLEIVELTGELLSRQLAELNDIFLQALRLS